MMFWLRISRKSIVVVAGLIFLFFGKPMVLESAEQKDLTIGERFHHGTSLTWFGALGDLFKAKPRKPSSYKHYPGAKIILLPKPKYNGMSLEEAIRKRRSIREYASKPMTMDQVSQLLFAAQGITGKQYGHPLRSVPSAGALYPFEIYVIVNRVKELPNGIYHYALLNHSLELVKSGNFGDEMIDGGLKQEMLGDSGVTFVLSAVFNRLRHKYGERGFRYAYMEAGHISQNIALQAVSLGLGSVCVGAFIDEKVNHLIGVDGYEEAVIYLHAVGRI